MIIAFIITIIVTVTGGFTYQYVAQQKPLETQLKQAQYSLVTLPIEQEAERITIEISPQSNASLEDAVHEIEMIMSKHSKESDLINITLAKQDQGELDSLWENQLFTVAEAMSSKQYSKLPVLMDSLQQQVEGLETIASIDSNYVYVTLSKDNLIKHVLLPINNQEMGVWNNA
ncbi:hypothetical protein NV377_23400 [Paenibacillus sp. T3-5-0-4]|nr:hypothetical protein [Paenibacillus endoradicis]